MKIAKTTNPPELAAAMMSIIIQRPYAYLEKELCSTFEGQEDVKMWGFFFEKYTQSQLSGAQRRNSSP